MEYQRVFTGFRDINSSVGDRQHALKSYESLASIINKRLRSCVDAGRGATAPEWRIQDTNIGSVEDVLRKFEAMPKNHEALEVMDDIQEQIKMNRENMDFVQFRIMEIAHEKEMWKLAGETYEEYQLRWKEAFAAARTYKNSLKRGQQNRERTEKRSDLESWKDNNTKQRIYIIEDAAVEKSKAVFRVPGIR